MDDLLLRAIVGFVIWIGCMVLIAALKRRMDCQRKMVNKQAHLEENEE